MKHLASPGILLLSIGLIGCTASTGPNIVGPSAPEWTNASSGECRMMGIDIKGLCAVGSKRSKNMQHAKTMACDIARSEFQKFIASKVKSGAKRAAESLSDNEKETFGERTIEGFTNKLVEALDINGVGCPKGHPVREKDGSINFFAMAYFSADKVAAAIASMGAVKELSEKKAAAIRKMSKEVTKELGL